MASLEQIVTSLDGRLEELHREVESLTHARHALVGHAGVPARLAQAPAQRQRPRRARPVGRRQTVELSAETLHPLICANDGISTAALAVLAHSDARSVLPILREMETSARVRRSGQRRATRWHAVISEEDWIAQRAAELAAHSTG